MERFSVETEDKGKKTAEEKQIFLPLSINSIAYSVSRYLQDKRYGRFHFHRLDDFLSEPFSEYHARGTFQRET